MSNKTKIKEVVSELLTVDTKTRDNDPYLYECVLRVIWVTGSIYYVLSTVDYQTVIRQRRLLQSKYPDLRWDSYKNRQSYSAVKRKEYSPSFWEKLNRVFAW